MIVFLFRKHVVYIFEFLNSFKVYNHEQHIIKQPEKKAIRLLLLEEIDEEDAIIRRFLKNKKSIHNMFLGRKSEGFFSILIEKHIFRDETKFREFFRLSWEQFIYVLNLIEDDIKCNPSNRVSEPITAAEKLAVTLR